jgi:hypothetical protein
VKPDRVTPKPGPIGTVASSQHKRFFDRYLRNADGNPSPRPQH